MMTHGSCDQPWLISRLREDNANQWLLTRLQPATSPPLFDERVNYNPYESVSAVRRPLCSAWRVMLNYVKSHVQQASVIAAPVRLFTCHSTGHVSSCPHRAVRSTAPLLPLLLLLMQMLPSSTETPYAVLWRADVRLILTTPGRTAVNNKSSRINHVIEWTEAP